MKINRDNYEAYFIDYLEGNLDETLVDDFIEFIRQNPDLKKEMELFKSVSLEPNDIEFKKKDELYKQKYDSETGFNQSAIARLEGDLNDEEKADFEAYLSTHSEKQKDVSLFEKTRLHPDESIKYQNKNQLYQQTSSRSLIIWAGRIAAVLVLAISVYIFTTNNTESISESQVATVTEENHVEENTETQNATEPETQNLAEIENVEEDQAAEMESGDEYNLPVNETIISEETNALTTENDPNAAEEIPARREIIIAPAKLNTRIAEVKTEQPNVLLAAVGRKEVTVPDIENPDDERLIGEVIRDKTGLDDLSVNKITKAGLNLFSAISKNNFSYETNSNGEVTELTFDSRLMAFSIPTNKE